VGLEQLGSLAGSSGFDKKRPASSSLLSRSILDVARVRLLEKATKELLRRANRGEYHQSRLINHVTTILSSLLPPSLSLFHRDAESLGSFARKVDKISFLRVVRDNRKLQTENYRQKSGDAYTGGWLLSSWQEQIPAVLIEMLFPRLPAMSMVFSSCTLVI